MTKLLARALEQVQTLTDQEQDAIAAMILAELDAEGVALARQRDEEIESGKTELLSEDEFRRRTTRAAQ